jgi:hypothetical protein
VGWQAQFAWGIVGSLGIEIVLLASVFDVAEPRWPAKYRHVGFVVVRLALVVFSGLLAVAYNVQNPLLAVNVGAAAPALYRALAEGIKAQSAR